MLKALIRTVVLVAAIVVLAHFVPLVAQYEWPLLLLVLALGLIGVIGRLFLILLLVAAVAALAYQFL